MLRILCLFHALKSYKCTEVGEVRYRKEQAININSMLILSFHQYLCEQEN